MTNPTGATEGDRVTSMVRRTHGAILWALAPYQIGGTSTVLRIADPHWITVPRPKPHGVS